MGPDCPQEWSSKKKRNGNGRHTSEGERIERERYNSTTGKR